MSYPAYPEYKDSGVEWLREVPVHWGVLPFFSRFSENKRSNKGMVEDNLLSLSYGRVIKKDINTLDGLLPESFETYQIIQPDDIVFRLTDLQNDKRSLRSAISEEKGIITSAYLSVRARGVNARFSSYLFRAYDLTKVFYAMGGGLRQSMKYGDMKWIPVLTPPESEQLKIATFLDHETTRIDALVEEQQRLIALLKEKRQAVISHAVTKGLDPDVPMKDSGVEWLGEVPEHWVVATLRRVLQTIEQGWSPECFNFPADECKWGVLKAGAVNNGVYRDTENKALPDGLAPKSNIEVLIGDLLMCRASGSPDLIGSAAYVKSTRPNLMLSDKLFRLVVNKEVCSEFIALSLGSMPLRRQIEQSINGAEGLANNLSQASIKNLKISLPPWSEQRQIVAELMRVLDGLKEQLDLASDTVTLLQERRSALISAAVTGKIDVRGWQPPLELSESRETADEV
ncbi:restriction endonuclease subunit S [Vreelandella alkaliphila]|uniref:restriction endonuclease subunit S n=1 Tax=Vreelandella alkaliphila TaxID=272774 RepID=UPI000EA07EE0|nr:restriction endonuclease subunit S [Halomonas alkaliphila]AYF33138.1 restriction endonuclease subunit S [Halomonas alkaliphila]